MPISRRTPLAVLLVLCLASPAVASWWTEEAPTLARTQGVETVTNVYRTYALDRVAFDAAAKDIPQSYTGAEGVEFELPGPDGVGVRFRVVEDPILGPLMQERRPDVRTFAGVGIDDPTATVRFAITKHGLSGFVASPVRGWTIEKLPRTPDGTFIVYDRADAAPSRFSCGTEHEELPRIEEIEQDLGRRLNGQIRNFEIAFNTTGELTAAAGGVSQAEDIVIALVNPLRIIFERELAVSFELVFVNAFTDAATDPFPNGNILNSTLLQQSDQALDAALGSFNYDIGHILTIDPSLGGASNGLAFVGVNCSSLKGGGGSRTGGAIAGAFFGVFFHEVGHQMGASHTFNTSANGCGDQRSNSWAYEIGSGVTIMGYGGICPPENVIGGDLGFFNAGSLAQMGSRLTSVSCADVSPSGNTPPVVVPQPDVTIPRETAFVLTGETTDVDGDAVTYAWEQFDLGPASPPIDPNAGPLFRNFEPSSNPSRSFPSYAQYRRNAATPWEFLPTVDRNMTFRLIARDNNPLGGEFAVDQVEVTVQGAPFRVLSPGGGDSFEGGTEVSVTWDKGGSLDANVRILVSDDEAISFTEVLASTPNDGEATILLPCDVTTQGRIRIEGLENPWFDLNDTAFSITPESLPPVVECPATFTIESPDGNGIPNDSPLLQPFVDAVNVIDNCGESIDPNFLFPPVLPIGTTNVAITATDAAGNLGFCASQITVEEAGATNAPSAARSGTGFVSVAPNPFNPRTVIEYAVAREQAITLEVYDVRGRRIDTLDVGVRGAGEHQVVWNGVDGDGNAVPSGVYFLQLTTEEGRFSERAVLLK